MIRIGHGYDIHRFEEMSMPQQFIILGGVKISHTKRLIAHSDGDVVIHAVCDALLGACALGDIGQHFPDTDPQYKDCDSRTLLRNVVQKIKNEGYCVSNLDVSIIAQAPKLAPHMMAMKENLAVDLDVSINHINLKATTNEGLDALGLGLGIAVHAVTLLEKNHETFN